MDTLVYSSIEGVLPSIQASTQAEIVTSREDLFHGTVMPII